MEYTRTCVSALVISAPSWALVETCPESCAVLGGDVYLVPLLNIFVQNFHSCLNNKLMDLQKCAMFVSGSLLLFLECKCCGSHGGSLFRAVPGGLAVHLSVHSHAWTQDKLQHYPCTKLATDLRLSCCDCLVAIVSLSPKSFVGRKHLFRRPQFVATRILTLHS